MKTKLHSSLKAFLILIVTIVAFSCTSTQKIKTYKQVSADNKNIFERSLDSLKKADSLRSVKFATGKLDNLSNKRISQFIDSLIRVSMNHLKDDSIMNRSKVSHTSIEYILAKAYRIAQQAKTQLDNIKLINELLAVNTFTQLDMATLFESGQYKLEGENRQKAVQSFSSIINDLAKFSEKFPGKKLVATIVVIGYADAQPISTDGELAAMLSEKLNKANPTNEELNRELSRLRAGSAATVIRQIIDSERSTSNRFTNLSIELLPQGRGEDYPTPSIKDYRTDDERRRVVNVYWSLLPVFTTE